MKVLTNNQYYSEIANVIREQNGTNNTYKPPQMVNALKDLFYEEAEGVPPISFNGIGENLLNYRIDGASGGVGEITSNLFDYKTWKNSITGVSNSGNIIYNNDNSFTIIANNINDVYTIGYNNYKLPVKAETNYYFNFSSNNTNAGLIYIFENGANDTAHRHIALNQSGKYVSFTTQPDATYIIIRFGVHVANTEITYKNISLVEGNSAPSNYEPYGYKVPVVVNGKNLFDETQVPDKSTSTEASNYQFFKQNGKLIVNGITTSNQVDTEISKENGVNNQALDFINNNAGNYIFTSSVPGRIMIRYKQNGSDVVRYTFNEYNSTNKIADRIVFRLQQNYQYDNETMNIMFKLNKIQSTNYEPYHEPTTTTIYLDEPIEANESISLSDTNTNIPTIRGTNILTVDTTVQPSNVYVKARKESSYETAMREDYEEQLSDIESALQEV